MADSTLTIGNPTRRAPGRPGPFFWPRDEDAFRTRIRIADRLVARVGWAKPEILITGFWRSGTTWLQECVARGARAKTVFEPFSPLVPRYAELIGDQRLSSEAARHAFIPMLRPDKDEAFWAYLDDAFRGYCPGDSALWCRHSLKESLLRRIAVKFVRLQFSLADVQARYGVPVVHIRRHPLSVVASLLRANWHWSFDEVTLEELMVGHEDGREALVDERMLEHCLRNYDGDMVARIATYWALTERAVEAQLARCRQARIVDYEALLSDPEQQLSALCADVGVPLTAPMEWRKDSVVTTPTPEDRPRWSRREGWREVLSETDQSRVLAIVEAVLERPPPPPPSRRPA